MRIDCGYPFKAEGIETVHACEASFDHYADFATHIRNGHHICRCGMGVQEAADEPDEGPEDAEPEPEQGGIITAGKLHMGILGNWVGWEAHEQANVRSPMVRMVRGGKLESYAVSEINMTPVIIVVSGAEYRVSPSQHFIWRRA